MLSLLRSIQGLLLLAILFAFMVVIFIVMTRKRQLVIKICLWLFAFSSITGYVLYSNGYSASMSSLNEIPGIALRAIFSTAGMFFLQADSAGVFEWLEDRIWLQLLFWFCHIAAAIVTQMAIVTLFGRKAVNFFRQWFGTHRAVYFIVGSAANIVTLGEQIASIKKDEALIIFLLEDIDDEKFVNEKITHFNSVAHVPDKTQDITYYLRKAGLGKGYQRRRKFNIVLMLDDNTSLLNTQKIADYAKTNKVNEQDMEVFVITVSRLNIDRIEKITMSLDDEKQTRKYPFTFNIICEMDEIARQMIKIHPPYDCMNLFCNNEIGKAKRDFTVLILGFGVVGQQAFLHLVINGQFVDSQMNATIIDKEATRQYYCFKQRYPEIELSCKVEINENTIPCETLYCLLDGIDSLDYIIIALGDDKENRQVAIDLNRYYKKIGKDFDATPYFAIHEENGALYEPNTEERMFSFGCLETIYLNSVIRFEEANKMAKALCAYDVHRYSERPWNEIEWSLQETYRFTADTIKTTLRLLGLTEEDVLNKRSLTEGDDKSTALTGNGAIIDTLAQTEHMRWLAFLRAEGYTQMSIADMWNRYECNKHRDIGKDIIACCRRDVDTLQHLCLAPWSELGQIGVEFTKMKNLVNIDNPETSSGYEYFKDVTRNIIKDIPDVLHEVKLHNNQNIP